MRGDYKMGSIPTIETYRKLICDSRFTVMWMAAG